METGIDMSRIPKVNILKTSPEVELMETEHQKLR